MRTNLEKWNYYHNLILERDNEYIKSVLPPEEIKEFYQVEYFGFLRELTVIGYEYWKPHIHLFFHGKKPKNSDVIYIKNFYEQPPEYQLHNVYLKVKDNYHSETTTRLIDVINENKGIFLDKEKALQLSEIKITENIQIKLFKELHKKDKFYNYGSNGYKFLGWQNGWRHVHYDKNGKETQNPSEYVSFGYRKEDYPEYGNCRELKHYLIEVQHTQQGSENTVSCPVCKIYWKYDSSD